VTLADPLRIAVAVAASLVLCFAAVSDIRTRRIPNWTVLALIGLFAIWMASDGGREALSALAAAAVALAVTVALYAFKILGAGDSKLFAAVALFGGLGYLPLLVLATALTGGVIAIASLAARPQRALAMLSMRGKGDWGRGVPYGLAIATGGALIMWAPITGIVKPIGARPDVTATQVKQFMEAPRPQPGAR